jgi:hypothetical protein
MLRTMRLVKAEEKGKRTFRVALYADVRSLRHGPQWPSRPKLDTMPHAENCELASWLTRERDNYRLDSVLLLAERARPDVHFVLLTLRVATVDLFESFARLPELVELFHELHFDAAERPLLAVS